MIEWVILVGQVVSGKSKFPHDKVGKFDRFKPWSYYSYKEPHRIIYARTFIDTEEFALAKAQQVEKEMFSTYVLGMGNIKTVCVTEYTVVLHNITKNISKQIGTTIKGKESDPQNYLFDYVFCDNAHLTEWGIIKGLK